MLNARDRFRVSHVVKLPLLLILPLVMLGQPIRLSPGIKSATITPNTEENAAFAILNIPPGSLKLRAVTLKKLILDAYDIRGSQLIGGPQWLERERWDIQVPWDGQSHQKLMLELITARFGLKAHPELRTTPIYELQAATSGPKMPSNPYPDARGPIITNRRGSIHLRDSSLEDFAKLLSFHLDKPVVNKVGATGPFSFALDWAPAPGEGGGIEAGDYPIGGPMPATTLKLPPIGRAIEEQLGLRLVPKPGPVKVIIVDKAERPRPN